VNTEVAVFSVLSLQNRCFQQKIPERCSQDRVFCQNAVFKSVWDKKNPRVKSFSLLYVWMQNVKKSNYVLGGF